MSSNSISASADVRVFPILLILAMGGFILGLTEFSMMPMLPLISETFSTTPSQSGYAISAYAIGVVVGAPILMMLTANMKKRNALAIFVGMVCVSNALSAFSETLNQLIVFRFLSGLPHGAYFGTAILLATDIAPKGQRSTFIAKVFLGLTIATIVGVPMVTLIGQNFSWRYCVAGAAVLALIMLVLIFKVLPNRKNATPSTLMSEFGVLKNKLVWTILGIVIVGFGGVFCIYTYIADTILAVTGTPDYTISIAMVMFGIGCTIGNLVLGKLGDKAAMPTTGIALVFSIIFALIYVYASHNIWFLYIIIFCIGASIGIGAVIQSLLMDISPKGHAMLGALVQCAFNTANAIGPWMGGIVIAQGALPNSSGMVAAALFTGGLVMWWLSYIQIKAKAQQKACGVVAEAC